MGQYYKPLSIDKKQFLYSHDYGNGLKLMEHSYIDNKLVGAVENLLLPGEPWYKTRIVWAGDYAEPEVEVGNGEVPYEKNENLYHTIGVDENKISPANVDIDREKYRYLCNHDKHQFVDLGKLVGDDVAPFGGELVIHPLPLLTAEGNGQGGGDYDGTRMDEIGSWARCHISLESEVPAGYEEINGKFIEG